MPWWGEWSNFFYPAVEGKQSCSDACGDISNQVRVRECVVEDLCVGANKDFLRCSTLAAPEICESQHAECDADGFRLV